MFTQFQGVKVRQPPRPPPKASRTGHNNGTFAHACTECRRRKSKCDAQRPCTRCRESKRVHLCQYVSQKRRAVPSRKTMDHLSDSLQQCHSILERLFPNEDPENLATKTREELAQMLEDIATLSTTNIKPCSTPSDSEPKSNRDQILEQLQTNPSEYDEQSRDYVADDVNALNLSESYNTSYVGSSSVSAALKVISKLCPNIMSLSNPPNAQSSFSRSELMTSQAISAPIPRVRQAAMIDAYFEHVHVLIPMVNEKQLRQNFDAGGELQAEQTALLNMVLALGSIAMEASTDTTHFTFYQRARDALSFDSFGTGKIEVIQALGLMGGYYLHYCNKPNMAVTIMGAALRMAYALGLHRISSPSYSDFTKASTHYTCDRVIKQRTWWSLACLDTWGSTTLGRPSMGDCFGPAILTPRPSFLENDSPDYSQYPFMTASVQFCELSAHKQQQLASSPSLSLEQMNDYDEKLQKIFNNFPPFLQAPNWCPRQLLVPRAILKWRYQNARLLLYRPVLLAAALARKSAIDLTEQERHSIDLCRDIAGNSIYDIACHSEPDAICGWNGVWLLFQATMVPLVSLFYEYNDMLRCGKWHSQIDVALRALEAMQMLSPVAQRTRQVIADMQKLSRQMANSEIAQIEIMNNQQQNEIILDEDWDGLQFSDCEDFLSLIADPVFNTCFQDMAASST